MATVTVKIQQKKSGRWVDVAVGEPENLHPWYLRRKANGIIKFECGSKNPGRATSGAPCKHYASADDYEFRSVIDADIWGMFDTPFKQYNYKALKCSSVGEGYGN